LSSEGIGVIADATAH